MHTTTRAAFIACIILIASAFNVSGTGKPALDAAIDTVKHILAGRKPLTELDSANVYLITRANIDYAQYEQIFGGYMIPFALKHRDKIPDADLAWLYRNYSIIFGMQEKDEQEIAAMDSAVLLIENVDDEPETKAAIYANAGDVQIKHGSISRGHELFFKAIGIYEQLGGNDVKISNNLYQLAVGYLQILDYKGLEFIIGKMQELCSNPNADPNCLYDLYSVKTTLYASLHDKSPGNKDLSDSTLLYSRKAIDIIERHGGELRQRIVPSWNYYNHARTLFHAPGKIQYDSIEAYLAKAQESIPGNRANIDREVRISIYLLQGEIARRQGNYVQAEKYASETDKLLAQDIESNTLVVEKEHLYRLYADIYEATGRYRDATKYRHLVETTMMQRFDNEKVEALKRLEVKYEVEKKEAAIASLAERNRASRRMMMLLATIIVVLAVAIALIVRVARLRRRNVEQKLYEAALLAELRQEELDNAREQIRQQTAIEQPHGIFAPIIAKIGNNIDTSALEAQSKDDYTTRLRNLDPARLDADFGDVAPQMTQMDLKYAICFYIEMEVKHIAAMFNVEPASVYTVRYRMRKKFRQSPAFRFLM